MSALAVPRAGSWLNLRWTLADMDDIAARARRGATSAALAAIMQSLKGEPVAAAEIRELCRRNGIPIRY